MTQSPPSGWVEDFHLQAVKHARHTRGSPHGRRSPTETWRYPISPKLQAIYYQHHHRIAAIRFARYGDQSLFFLLVRSMNGRAVRRWRFPGADLSVSHLFSIISIQISKSLVFIDITGWVAKCLKPLRVFNNITGWTFIFHTRASLIDD